MNGRARKIHNKLLFLRNRSLLGDLLNPYPHDLIIKSIASTLEMTRNYGKMIAAKSLGHEVILTVWNTPETNNLLGPIDVTNQSRDSEIKKSGETVTFFLIKVLGRDHSNIIMMYEEIMPRSKDVARQAGMHAVAMETIGA